MRTLVCQNNTNCSEKLLTLTWLKTLKFKYSLLTTTFVTKVLTKQIKQLLNPSSSLVQLQCLVLDSVLLYSFETRGDSAPLLMSHIGIQCISFDVTNFDMKDCFAFLYAVKTKNNMVSQLADPIVWEFLYTW